MNCCQCQGVETQFDRRVATRELQHYRQKGPPKTTRLLIELLEAEGVEGMTILDIGGGVGAIQYELLQAGAARATSVEASTAFFEIAYEEARRRGLADRIHAMHGNFVDLAPDLPPADIVTLDRVICCYDDMEALVRLSSTRARRLYGVVYPRDTWWMRLVTRLQNFGFWLRRNPFRLFIHPTEAVDAEVRSNGLKPHLRRQTFIWQVLVYVREA